ncbi:MAG: uroporphyrinogen-III synthase [Burkholderiales bacterium]|nr:uroporphyrinogen-III synthase [Burkholderiales bacterium]MDE2452283.1 uroporphyrinogen-III synthase [Burkholderiales bacterium]
MRVLVTRPPRQAADWVARLRRLGLDAAALPLIGIAEVEDPAPLQAAWATLAARSLVVFVSPNAVEHFFARRAPAQAWPAATLAGSTGPGTSAALRAAGLGEAQLVEPGVDAPSFDSEALWARLAGRDWGGRSVLVVRGEDGREWLSQTLRARGARVDFVAAYRRLPPLLDAAGAALLAAALADPAAHLWLFSSSEALRHLQALAPGAAWGGSRAAASHPRIVQSARELGFGRVDALAPDPEAVAALLRRTPIQSPPQ